MNLNLCFNIMLHFSLQHTCCSCHSRGSGHILGRWSPPNVIFADQTDTTPDWPRVLTPPAVAGRSTQLYFQFWILYCMHAGIYINSCPCMPFTLCWFLQINGRYSHSSVLILWLIHHLHVPCCSVLSLHEKQTNSSPSFLVPLLYMPYHSDIHQVPWRSC